MTYPATIQPCVNGWHSDNPHHTHVRVMIPALETVRVNEWGPGVWLMSSKWRKPRRFRGVSDGRVWMPGGSAVAFPEDIRRVSAPEDGVVRRRGRKCGKRPTPGGA